MNPSGTMNVPGAVHCSPRWCSYPHCPKSLVAIIVVSSLERAYESCHRGHVLLQVWPRKLTVWSKSSAAGPRVAGRRAAIGFSGTGLTSGVSPVPVRPARPGITNGSEGLTTQAMARSCVPLGSTAKKKLVQSGSMQATWKQPEATRPCFGDNNKSLQTRVQLFPTFKGSII